MFGFAQRKRLGLRTEGDMPKKRNRDNPLETSLPLGTALLCFVALR